MKKKPVYETLDRLINREWKTSLTITSNAQGWFVSEVLRDITVLLG